MKIVFLALVLTSVIAFAKDKKVSLADRATEKFDPLAGTKAEQLGEKNGFTIVKMSGTYKVRGFEDEPFAACFAQKGGKIYKVDLPDDMKCEDDLSVIKKNINSVNVESDKPLKVEKEAVTDGRTLTYHRGSKKDADGKPIGKVFSGSTILEKRAEYTATAGNGDLRGSGVHPYTALHLWVRSNKGNGRFEVAADNVTVEHPNGSDNVLVDHSAGLKEDMRTVVVQAPPPPAPVVQKEEKKPEEKKPAPVPVVEEKKDPPPVEKKEEKKVEQKPVDPCAPLANKLSEKNWQKYCAALNTPQCGKIVFKGACKETCSARDCSSDYDLLTNKAVSDQDAKITNNTCDNKSVANVQGLADDLRGKRDTFSEAADHFRDVVLKQGTVGKCINISKSDSKYDVMDKVFLANKLGEEESFCSSHKPGNAPSKKKKEKDDSGGGKMSEGESDPNRGVASETSN